MALNQVTLTLDVYRGDGSPIQAGTAFFVASSVLVDTTNHQVVWQYPIPVALEPPEGAADDWLPTVTLYSCDSSNLVPDGWAWTVSFQAPGAPEPFSFQLDYSNGASQYLSEQAPLYTAPVLTGYVPLPPGAPTTGEVPTATGSGYSMEWGTGGSGGLPLPGGTPSSGQVPVATGSGDASDWTTLTASDVDALPLPSGTPSSGQVPVATGTGDASAWTTLTASDAGAAELTNGMVSGGIITVSETAPLWPGPVDFWINPTVSVGLSDIAAPVSPFSMAGYELQNLGVPLSPSSGARLADLITPHPNPADEGYAGWNFDPITEQTSTTITAGLLYLLRVVPFLTTSISTVVFDLTSEGTATADENFVAVFTTASTSGNPTLALAEASSAGTLDSYLSSGGKVPCPLASSVAVTAGVPVYVGILINGTGTWKVAAGSNTPGTENAVGPRGALNRCGTGGSQTTMPSSPTFATTTPVSIWVGIG